MLMDYSEENAKLLVENSQDFDNWLNEVVFDLENFRTQGKEENKEETSDIS